MSQHGLVRKVEGFVRALKTGTDKEKSNAKSAVGELLTQSVLELPADRQKEVENLVNLSIYECFVEGNQLAGLMLIDELVDIDYMESSLKITRFANYLRGALPTSDPKQAALVARTLGKIASIGAVLSTEVIEAELRRSIEWLAVINSVNDLGHRRCSAVMVITEILLRAPHTIATRAEAILAYVANGIRDIRKVVQIKCFEMINLLLKVLSDRSVRTRDNWYQCLFNDALELIETHAPYVHSTDNGDVESAEATEMHEAAYNGGLLILSALYLSKQVRRGRSTLLLSKYSFAFAMLLETLQERRGNLNVVWCYVKVFESLCVYHPEAFCHLYLAKAIDCFVALWGGALSDSGSSLLQHREYRSYLLRLLLCSLETAKTCLAGDSGVAKSIGSTISSSGQQLLDLLRREVSKCGSDAFIKEQKGTRWGGRPRSESSDPKSRSRMVADARDLLSHNNNYNGGLALLCLAGTVELAHATATVSVRRDLTGPESLPLPEAVEPVEAVDPPPQETCGVLEEREVLEVISLGLANLGVTMEVCEAASRVGAVSASTNDTMYKKILLALRQTLVLLASQEQGTAEQEIKHSLFMLANVAKMEPVRVVAYSLVQCIVPYFTHPSDTLRLVAVKVMGDVLNSTHSARPGGTALAAGFPVVENPSIRAHPLEGVPNVSSEVVERLIQVAATDQSPEVRITALSVLPRQLDSLLCQENVYKMIVTISYDVGTDASTYLVRLASLKVLSRLSSRQPALQPHIRKLLINVLNELSLVKENSLEYKRSAELLRHVIATAPSLAQMYAAAIRDALLPKAKLATGLTTEVILTLEKLALVVGRANMDVAAVVGVVLKALDEGKATAQRRVACLQCLAAWMRALDWDEHPYERFPTLLPLLLRILQTPLPHVAAEEGIHNGVMHVLGTAGAYEPHRIASQLATRQQKSMKVANKIHPEANVGAGVTVRSSRRRVRIDRAPGNTRQVPNLMTKARRDNGALSFDTVEEELDLSPLVFQNLHSGGEPTESHLSGYNQSLAIRVMLRVILDRSLASVHHKMAVGALVMIIRKVSPTEYSVFLDPTYRALLALLSSLSSSDAGPLISFVIQQIRLLSEIVKDHARVYLPDIFTTVCMLCTRRRNLESEVLNQVLSLFNDFRRIYKECITPHLRKIVPVIDLAVRLRPGRTAQPVLKGLTAMSTLGPLLDGYLTFLLPSVCSCFSDDVVLKLVGTPLPKIVETGSLSVRHRSGVPPSSLSLSLASTYPTQSDVETHTVALDTSILAESSAAVASPDTTSLALNTMAHRSVSEEDAKNVMTPQERTLSAADSLPAAALVDPETPTTLVLTTPVLGATRGPSLPWEGGGTLGAASSLVYAPPSSGLMATGAATSGVVSPTGLLRGPGDVAAGGTRRRRLSSSSVSASYPSTPPPEGRVPVGTNSGTPSPIPSPKAVESEGPASPDTAPQNVQDFGRDLTSFSRLDCYHVSAKAIATLVQLAQQTDLRSFSVRILNALLALLSADPTPRDGKMLATPTSSSGVLRSGMTSTFVSTEDTAQGKMHRVRGSSTDKVRNHGMIAGMEDSTEIFMLQDGRVLEEKLLPQLEAEAVGALAVLIPHLKGSIPLTLIEEIAALVAKKNLETEAFRQAIATPKQDPHRRSRSQFSNPHERRPSSDDRMRPERDAEIRDLTCNMRTLSKALDVSSLNSVSDWAEWLRVLRIELVRESPNHAIRSCANLAQVNRSVAKELFNAAFVSCYLYLQPPHKGTLLGAIGSAIGSPSIPSDLLQPLLSLAEFMEHMEVTQSVPGSPTPVFGVGSRQHSPAPQVESFNFAASEVISSVCQSASLGGNQLMALRGYLGASPLRAASLVASQSLLPTPAGSVPQQGTPHELFMTTRDDVYRESRQAATPQVSPSKPSARVLPPRGPRAATPSPLPSELDLVVLADKAERCRMYAKALHYREMLFESQLKHETSGFFGQYVDGYVVPFHSLEHDTLQGVWQGWVTHVVRIVRLNQHLRNQHSAQGILEFALANFKRVRCVSACDYIPQVDASIYEELHQWDRAKDEWLHVLYGGEGGQELFGGSDAADQDTLDSFKLDSPGLHPRDLKALQSTPPLSAATRPIDTPSESPISDSGSRYTLSLAMASERAKDPLEREASSSKSHAAQGLVRALRNLGEWSAVLQIADKVGLYSEVADETARAAWMMQDWDVMERAVSLIESNDVQAHVFQSALAIQQCRFRDASALVSAARKLIQPDVAALASESYSRAYPLMVKMQVLSEFDEVIQWHERGGLAAHEPDELSGLLVMWKSRLLATERLSVYWEEILATRSLLVPPQQQLECWLKYVSMARKSNKLSLARSTLSMLMNVGAQETLAEKVASVDPTDKRASHPWLVSACCDYLWHTGEHDHAPQLLHDYLENLVQATEGSEYSSVKGKYYRKLGEWYQELHADGYWLPPQRAVVMRLLRKACLYDPQSWKVWSKWAMMNLKVITMCMMNDARVIPFLLQAAEGLMHVIQLTQGCIQDLLRLLGLWFSHGHIGQVARGMRTVFSQIATNNWLQVIPQIVARMHHSNSTIRALLHQLLVNLGKDHGQAVVYPLLCVLCSEDPKRAQAGKDVLDRIAIFSPSLVTEGKLVATNLAKVALILAEQWGCSIEEARWQIYNENNPQEGIRIFHTLNSLMETKPTSEHEKMFHQHFADELTVAHALVLTAEAFLNSKKEAALRHFSMKLSEALSIYVKVHKEIEQRLAKMPTLDLNHTNPQLSSAESLSVSIPGTYEPNRPVITIKNFQSNCIIIPSKQRPRKIVMTGSDGNEYAFLLKGREDLRQDERVMQLFSLINQILSEDRQTAKEQNNIELYPVIPLASSAGLIGWLCQAETLYTLIKDYRKAHNISVTQEKGLIPMIVGGGAKPLHTNANAVYDKLCVYQKVDVFELVLESTKGDDLSRVMWLQSKSSEAWVGTREMYTRSLAVMSMVGYLMGLGDRHPSNLMIDKNSRKIIHIDFGDCFEVASNRARFPEKVPFRLTRMLIKAMDFAGVDGMFTKTSEDVMRVLRKNRSSLMSILSSFLHDPLINWRLVDSGGKLREENPAQQPSLMSLFEDDGNSPTEQHLKQSHFFSEQHETLPHTLDPHRSLAMFTKREETRDKEGQNTRVQKQALDALQRIRMKLDGKVYKMTSNDDLHHTQAPIEQETEDKQSYDTTAEGSCGECETATATLRCVDCGDVFCDACSSVIHSKRRNRGHTNTVRLPEQSAAFLRAKLAGFDLYVTATHGALPAELLSALTKRVISIQKVIRGFLARKTLTVTQDAFEGNQQASEEGSQPGGETVQVYDTEEQVSLLIREAIAHEHLAVAYSGWCPWW